MVYQVFERRWTGERFKAKWVFTASQEHIQAMLEDFSQRSPYVLYFKYSMSDFDVIVYYVGGQQVDREQAIDHERNIRAGNLPDKSNRWYPDELRWGD